MRTTLWIAWRYLWRGRRSFISFVTWISLLGMSLGVAALTVVIGVMNGFELELEDRLLGSIPHLLIEEGSEKTFLDSIENDANVVGVYPFLVGEGMITDGSSTQAVTIFGASQKWIESKPRIFSSFEYGDLESLMESNTNLSMGIGLGRFLRLSPNSPVRVFVMEPTENGVIPQVLEYRVSGLFHLGADLDYSLIIVPIESLRGLAKGSLSRAEYRVDIQDPMDIEKLENRLKVAKPEIKMVSWVDTYGDLFTAVELERNMMFLIILMIVMIASFNIVSGQLMTVNDKQAAIAILRTIGATGPMIIKIFLFQGLVISTLGVIAGLAVGLFLSVNIDLVFSWIEASIGFDFLQGTYYQAVPSSISGPDLFIIAVSSFIICSAASWLPARKAASQNPLIGLHDP